MQKIIPDTVLLKRLIKMFRHFFFFFLYANRNEQQSKSIDQLQNPLLKEGRENLKNLCHLYATCSCIFSLISHFSIISNLKFKTLHSFFVNWQCTICIADDHMTRRKDATKYSRELLINLCLTHHCGTVTKQDRFDFSMKHETPFSEFPLFIYIPSKSKKGQCKLMTKWLCTRYKCSLHSINIKVNINIQ